ncbi:MAG TPA: toll/interleukin-1 receptor domain-containing protein [Thermoleophilaceae bacterium]|nr:toll/interleukin-1 receptor domain-containing protein [Thermoleophilaceae bacterium]
MPKRFDANKFNREIRAAQRKAEAEVKREVDRVNRANQRNVDAYNREVDRTNRENQRRVDAHNRKIDQQNKKTVTDYNRHVSKVNAHNRAAVADLNRQLRAASTGPRYTDDEQVLADRIQHAVAQHDTREWDTFLSYARIDGAETGDELRRHLESLGVSVWFDEIAVEPGKSQALQMDKGLQKAQVGIVLLTPAYLVGRFWTERELGALLHKETLIPVLHGVTFDQVAEYSGILPDLAGFETSRDPVEIIAQKIAAAVVND